MAVLTLLECGSIQNYVFASNRLKEAIGGSYLIKQALSGFLLEALEKAVGVGCFSTNWQKANVLTALNDTDMQAEILYIGGGNAVVLFVNEKVALKTINYLSSCLLSQAPGLVLLVGHSQSNSRNLAYQLEEAQLNLFKLKEANYTLARREGLAVTASCQTTGLAATIRYPASDRKQDFDNLSAAAAAKRGAADEAQAADQSLLNEIQKQICPNKYKFTDQLDELGRETGESHIAIVHIDGNSVGSRLKKILDTAKTEEWDDNKVAHAIRSFSKSVESAAQVALHQTIQSLIISLEGSLKEKLNLVSDQNQVYLPLRLLISGGDDLTFVCDGRIGLALAARYLRFFNAESDWQQLHFTACAGVVITHTHFPLARAYRISEDLCQDAKRKARKEANSSWLNFEILLSGLANISSQLHYNGNLLWRPYRVAGDSSDIYDWQYFEQHLKYFAKWPRSVVKGLRDALIEGESTTEQFLQQAKLRGQYLYIIPGISLDNGWFAGHTPYFDPIEAFDFFLEV